MGKNDNGAAGSLEPGSAVALPDGEYMLSAGNEYNKFRNRDELEIFAYVNKINLTFADKVGM